jgi:site-specific recombinase XerD
VSQRGDDIARVKKPKRLPVALTQQEVQSVLAHLQRDAWLMGNLLYSAGLRLMGYLSVTAPGQRRPSKHRIKG